MAYFQSVGFRVGVLVAVTIALIAGMTLRVSEDPSSFGRSTKAWFMLDDATGIVRSSSVKMAGIPVGMVKDIRLYHGRARMDLEMPPDVTLYKNAAVKVRSTGILGDRYIEITRGDPATGALENGAEITNINTSGSMDAIVDDIGKLSKSLTEVAESLREAANGQGDRERPLAKIVDNLERLTGELADLSEDNHERLDEIIANIHDVSGNLKKMTDDANIKKIDRTLANLEEITDKVNSGKGTIGKLVNDEKTVDELNSAIASVNKFMDKAEKMQVSVDVRTDYLSQPGLYKSYLGVKIKPGLDRYYELQILNDPRGVIDRVNTTSVNDPGGTITSSETKIYKDRIKFSAIFAKNFYDFTFKGGIIESSGGFGVDYYLLRRNLRVGLEAFNFNANLVPNLRASARYNVTRGIYLNGGVDDIISNQGNTSTYVGAGLDFSNDDLKLLLTKAPF